MVLPCARRIKWVTSTLHWDFGTVLNLLGNSPLIPLRGYWPLANDRVLTMQPSTFLLNLASSSSTILIAWTEERELTNAAEPGPFWSGLYLSIICLNRLFWMKSIFQWIISHWDFTEKKRFVFLKSVFLGTSELVPSEVYLRVLSRGLESQFLRLVNSRCWQYHQIAGRSSVESHQAQCREKTLCGLSLTTRGTVKALSSDSRIIRSQVPYKGMQFTD